MNEVEKKRQEVENYQRILDKYGSGRWFRKGQRRLEELKKELEELERNLGL